MTLQRSVLAATLLCLASAAVAWLMAPFPAPSVPAQPIEESWNLPSDAPPKIADALATIHRLHPWGVPPPEATAQAANAQQGQPGQPGQVASPPPPWRVTGLIRKGEDSMAIINTPAHPPLRPGDNLPDGATILRQQGSTLEIRRNDKTEQIKLYER